MIRKKPAPHLMRGGHRFSEKIMLKQNARARWRIEETSFGLAPRRKSYANGAQRCAPFCFWPDFREMPLATSRARRDNLISQLTNTVETTCSTNQPPNPRFAPPARSRDS